jgi:hypothetical protein
MRSVLLCTWIAAAGVWAQQAPPARIAGKPNLTGVWQYIGEANWNLEPHSAGPGTMWETGAIGAVPPGQGVVEGGTIPYKPEALARRNENFAKRRTDDPEAKCYMPGIPRATYMPYPFQIIQSTDKILFAYQYATANRVVHLGARKPDLTDSWMGTSNGRWEGDSLIVEVTGLNGLAWLDRAGNYTSNRVKVTERYTPAGPNHINYEATIDDPQVFLRPWKIALTLYRRMEPNASILEFKCVEFSEELLYGHLTKK